MNTGSSPGMHPESIRSFKSNGAITRYAAVCLSGSVTGDVALPASANADPIGLAMEAVADNKAVAIVRGGSYRAVASAAISRNDWVVIADTDGKLKTDPATSATTSYRIGKALTPASADGDLFIVELNIHAVYNA